MNKLLPIIFLVFTVNSVIAQYTGGNNDGYGDGTLTQTTCPDLTPNYIYYGGNNDGYSDGTLTQSACPNLTPNFIYSGGNNDGYSDGTLTQSTCPNLTPNFIYFGGNNDGYSDGTLTQSTCPNLTPNFIYYGGNNDGYSDGTLAQSTCPNITPNFIYYGGNNDGYSDVTLAQSTCPNITPNFIYYGGISDGFGWHFIQPVICTTPLPIQLLEFKAKLGKEGVEISWVTATEINNDFFSVEKSNNGFDFSAIANIKGAGNSTKQLSYTVTDISPSQGVNYYRLKQTDYDGKFDYSRVVSVDVESSLSTNSIYPNPNEGNSFYIKVPNSGYRNILIKIQGLDGKTILSETVYVSGTFEFFPSVKLASGVYIISIFDNLNFSNVKLVIK